MFTLTRGYFVKRKLMVQIFEISIHVVLANLL